MRRILSYIVGFFLAGSFAASIPVRAEITQAPVYLFLDDNVDTNFFTVWQHIFVIQGALPNESVLLGILEGERPSPTVFPNWDVAYIHGFFKNLERFVYSDRAKQLQNNSERLNYQSRVVPDVMMRVMGFPEPKICVPNGLMKEHLGFVRFPEVNDPLDHGDFFVIGGREIRTVEGTHAVTRARVINRTIVGLTRRDGIRHGLIGYQVEREAFPNVNGDIRVFDGDIRFLRAPESDESPRLLDLHR